MATVSIIVPIHEEAHHLEAVLERCWTADCPIARDFILVDDGSTDGTPELCDRFASGHEGVRVIRKSHEGKGSAVHAGLAEARGEYVVIQDADFEYDPADIPRLLAPLLADEADVVFGSRFRRERIQVHRTFHFLANRLLTLISNVTSGVYLTDTHSCYKAFRSDLVCSMRLRSTRFGFEAESTAYVAKTQARLVEIPISYDPRSRAMGKKIGWRDGVEALGHYFYYNLVVSMDDAFDALPERYSQRR